MWRAAVRGMRNSIRPKSQAQGGAAGVGADNRAGGAGRVANGREKLDCPRHTGSEGNLFSDRVCRNGWQT